MSVYQDDVTIDIDGFDVITHDFVNLRPGSFYDVIIETSEDGYFYSENIGTVSTGSYYKLYMYTFLNKIKVKKQNKNIIFILLNVYSQS